MRCELTQFIYARALFPAKIMPNGIGQAEIFHSSAGFRIVQTCLSDSLMNLLLPSVFTFIANINWAIAIDLRRLFAIYVNHENRLYSRFTYLMTAEMFVW